MQFDPDMLTYLRAIARRDRETADRAEVRLDEAGWDNFPRVLMMVFCLTLRLRLGTAPNYAQIMQFVAELRSAAPGDPADIDAAAAGSLIAATFGQDIGPEEVEADMAIQIQVSTLTHVLGAPEVTEEEVDEVFQLSALALEMAPQVRPT
ncbi:hypothetical protein AB0J86_37295 [Micromonospora sp. NPDC049559]|uniref:hypothetical protein n=1 Tax=Micromonospora sp. NPDC049559 TaxID=3155923 RepID=UPI0034405961